MKAVRRARRLSLPLKRLTQRVQCSVERVRDVGAILDRDGTRSDQVIRGNIELRERSKIAGWPAGFESADISLCRQALSILSVLAEHAKKANEIFGEGREGGGRPTKHPDMRAVRPSKAEEQHELCLALTGFGETIDNQSLVIRIERVVPTIAERSVSLLPRQVVPLLTHIGETALVIGNPNHVFALSLVGLDFGIVT